MKIKSNAFRPTAGFTLVELLVVIAIIGTLAALAFTMGPKMLKRGAAAKSVQNIRQIGALIMGYGSDHGGRLPPMRGEVVDASGKNVETHWHQALLVAAYPDVPVEKMDDKWYESVKPFMRNPLCTKTSKPAAFANWNPGYAMNRQIASNLKLNVSEDWSPGKNGPQTTEVPLSAIPDPSLTPIVVPRGDWHYVASDLQSTDFKGFLVEGKFPVLFLDGHIESMTPNDYTLARPKGRDLGNVPKPK
jgi:prepilin-type N-terminal cleavage/methylation domain-containing protein